MNMNMLAANDQKRFLTIAGGGAIIAAVGTMLVPTAVLEALTGATGLSEIFQATAAPLGDTARALIAFATGVIAFALLALWLSKKNGNTTESVAPTFNAAPVEQTEFATERKASAASLVSQLRAKFEQIVSRARGKADAQDMDDYPKLRSRDVHPDAPARRPLLANRDLADIGSRAPDDYVPEVLLPAAGSPLMAKKLPAVADEAPVFVPAPVPVVAVVQGPEVAIAPAAEPMVPNFGVEFDAEDDGLLPMVDKLEAALAQRQAQLEKLESISRRIAEEAQTTAMPLAMPLAMPVVAPVAEVEDHPVVERRLEAVEATGSAIPQPRNGDDALRSALETLHRMNARSN